MDTWTPQRFLHALKGAPLVCLLGLRWLRRPVGVGELAECTGYERDTVAKGLRVLAVWGLAETPGGYGQWRLTAAAVQLPLFTPDQLVEGGVSAELAEKTRQFAGSSSSLINPLNEQDKLLPLPDLAEKTRQFAPETAPFSAECCRLAEVLVTRTGCGRSRARQAVQQALEEHDLTPAAVEIEIITWAHYCRQRTGKGIDNPGAFVAAKLARNEPAPAYVDLGNYSDDYWRVQALCQQESGTWEQESADEFDEGEDP
jgi:hypothetical protein